MRTLSSVDAEPQTAFVEATLEIFPGCFAGNRDFPRRDWAHQLHFDQRGQPQTTMKETFMRANQALKYFRKKLMDPERSGQPLFHDLDLTQEGSIAVPVVERYTKAVVQSHPEKHRAG